MRYFIQKFLRKNNTIKEHDIIVIADKYAMTYDELKALLDECVLAKRLYREENDNGISCYTSACDLEKPLECL